MCVLFANLSPKRRNSIVRGICVVPLSTAVCSMILGIWLGGAVIHNGGQPLDQQLHYEKDIKWDENNRNGGGTDHGMILFNDTDSHFSNIPLDNLSFYLLILSFVMVFGGFARTLVTAIFCNHFCRLKLTKQFYWSWFILGCITVLAELLLGHDILNAISHPNVSPPCYSDFFFTNDNYAFYWFCHILHIFIWVDMALHCITQFVMFVMYYCSKISELYSYD